MTRFQKADLACAEEAQRHHGCFHRNFALSAGHTQASIDSRLRRGRWRLIFPNVYAFAGAPDTPYLHLSAALLWAGEGSMVAVFRAAAFHGLRTYEAEEGVEICGYDRLKPPDGITFHYITGYLEFQPTRIDGFPVCPIEKVLLDLAWFATPRRFQLALDDSLQRGLTDLDKLWEFLEIVACRGRNGVQNLRKALEERDSRFHQLRSLSESDALKLFNNELPAFSVNHQIFVDGALVAEADFAFPEIKLDIEIDGYRVHSGSIDKDHDRKRDRKLGLLGWTVMRFSWKEVRDEPQRVLREIRAMLKKLGHPAVA